MFTNTMGQGFHVEFNNGWQVSVQWGGGCYCDNKGEKTTRKLMLQSRTAEVLVTDAYGRDERVQGWMTADKVAKLLANVARRRAGSRTRRPAL